jgi:hypothetical protein
MMSYVKLSLALLAVACVAMAGCSGGSDVGTVPVSGTVTVDGNPIEGATVSFVPQGEEGRSASGLTDAEGKFSLTTVQSGDGAVPGQYKVAISKITGSAGSTSTAAGGGTPSQEEMQKAMEASMKQAMSSRPPEVKEEIPPKYTNPDTSGLDREVVSSGDNNFAFELTSS